MKKLYQKKDLSVELQRRHTIMEVDKEGTNSNKQLKPVSRSNSTSSMYKTPRTQNVSSDSASSSTASTVVITESELASSWLYNNKKAQNEAASTCDSTAQLASNKEEMKSPIFPRPKVTFMNSSNKRSKCTSCCCYLSVILIVCLSTMGILSAVGGIIYMELFSTLKDTENQTMDSDLRDSEIAKFDDFYPMRKIGESHDFGESQSFDTGSTANRKSEKGIIKFSAKLDKNSDKAMLDKNKETKDHDDKSAQAIIETRKKEENSNLKEKELLPTELPVLADSLDNDSIEEDIAKIIYNISENFNPMKNFLFNQDGNSPYSKLYELYKGIQSNSRNLETSSQSINPENIDSEIVTEIIDPEAIDVNLESIDITSKPALFSNDSHHIMGTEHEENKDLKESELRSDINSILAVEDLTEEDNFKDNSEENFSKSHSNEDPSKKEDHKKETHFKEDKPKDNLKVDHLEEGNLEGGNLNGNQFKEDNSKEDNLKEEHLKEDHPKEDHLTEDLAKEILLKEDDTQEALIKDDNAEDGTHKDRLKESNFEENSKEDDFKLKPVKIEDSTIPMYFFKRPIESIDQKGRSEIDLGKMLDLEDTEEDNKNLELSPAPMGRFLPHIPDFFQQNEKSEEDTSLEKSDEKIGQEFDVPLELNRPISEVAVPKPIDMFKRFTKKNTNEATMVQEELKNDDRQFSLAKALERLRQLDIINIFPTSRAARDKKNSIQKITGPKMQTEEEISSERSIYLQTLRKKLFENE